MTVFDVLNKYAMPAHEAAILWEAVAYYERNHSGITVDFTFIVQEAPGKADTKSLETAGKITIFVPTPYHNGGRVPVADVDGGTNNTFLIYDDAVGPVHELGHAILALIGVGNLEATDELNIAVLAAAAAEAIGSGKDIVEELRKIYSADTFANGAVSKVEVALNQLTLAKNSLTDYIDDYGVEGTEYPLYVKDVEKYAQDLKDAEAAYEKALTDGTGWDTAKKLAIASEPQSSFENVFNTARNFYEIAGLSQVPSPYRTGYVTHEDVGMDDEWTSFTSGGSSNVSGSRTRLVSEGKAIAWLGNQYDNTIETGAGDDYIDGGKGIDVLQGNGGKDTLIGGTGSDQLYGGEGDDTLFGMNGYGTSDNGEADYLYGGADYDTYIAGDGDTINDSDGKGIVAFEGNILTGGKLVGGDELYAQYEGDGGTYYFLRTNNTLIFQKGEKFLTIENFTKELNDLGIVLENKELEISIFAPTVSEKDGIATGAITLNHAYTEDVIVTMYTQDDTATAGSDYSARPTFDVRILAGQTYAEFSISILNNDQEPEPTETFYALVDSVRTINSQSVNFTLVDVQPFTIEDDDTKDDTPAPNDGYVHVKISDASRVEDNTMMRFNITLSKALEKDITIDLATMDGTAVSGLDYAGSAGSVTITKGSTSAYYNVMIFEDDEIEGNETFTLTPTGHNYLNGQYQVLLDNAAIGTIIDDDVPVEVTFSSAQASELSGAIHFTVSISKVLDWDLDIDFDTFDGTAIGGSDYAGLSGTVTITAGSRTAEITIPLVNDIIPEDIEYFTIAPTGYAIADDFEREVA